MTTKSAAQVGGSLYFGWYIVATCFFVAFLSIPGRQGFGLFVTEMEPTFGWDRADISWVGSIGFLINGAMQPIMGALFDKYGPRKVFGIGLVVMGLAIMSLAFITDLEAVLNLGFVAIPLDLLWFIAVFSIVINTCLSAASITNMLALVVRWFQRKRSKARGAGVVRHIHRRPADHTLRRVPDGRHRLVGHRVGRFGAGGLEDGVVPAGHGGGRGRRAAGGCSS